MKPKVLLRADGDPSIGLGHITRTVALGSILRNSFECTLYTRFISTYIENIAKKSQIQVVKIVESDAHFNEFLDMVDENHIVVLDNYFFDTDYQIALKRKGCKLVCIDDLHDQPYASDVVINYSPIVGAQDFDLMTDTKLLLGLDYILLREGFLKEPPRASSNMLKNVLVCFGGSDYENLGIKVTTEVLETNANYHISIIVGASYLYSDELNALASSNENISVFQNLSEDEMINLIVRTDLAVVPSSTILFEVIALHKPFITGYYAKNQIEVAEYFRSNGAVVKGDFKKNRITHEDIQTAYDFNGTFQQVDGLSHQRILAAFKELRI